MKAGVFALVVAGAALTAACDIEGGDPVQHALRDASAARHAAALKTTEELEAQAIQARQASVADTGDDLSRLIVARRQAVADTRALLASTSDPTLKAQLTNDLKADEDRLRALEARQGRP